MTNFLSAEFIRRKFGGHGSCRAEIFGRAGARPSKPLPFKNPFAIFRSLFATRHSLLAAVLARHELRPPVCPPTEVGVYEGEAC
jgi:hypothetical protein